MTLTSTFRLLTIFTGDEKPLLLQTLRDLLVKEDYIAFLGRAFLETQHDLDIGSVEGEPEFICIAVRRTHIDPIVGRPELAAIIKTTQATFPAIKEYYIVRPWMQVANSFLALLRSGYSRDDHMQLAISDRLEGWRKFGMALGIDEATRRKEESERATVKMHGMAGCGWMKCPLYKSDHVVSGLRMMACSGCQKVRPPAISSGDRSASSTPISRLSIAVLPASGCKSLFIHVTAAQSST